jgi:hypothetical protein
MFTTVAYSMQRVGATVPLTVVTPVADSHVTIDGNNVVIPKGMNKLLGACFAYGTGLASAVAGAYLGQLQSPSLRRVFNNEAARIADTFAHEIHSEHIQMFEDSPLPLDEGEGLQAWTAHPALALGETAVYVHLCDGPSAKVAGEIRTIRFTSVCAPVTRVWTLGVLGVVQQLPMGDYAVVGARLTNATEFGAFRLIFTGYDWRPGGLITHTLDSQDVLHQRAGHLGVWGTFNWMQLPRIEICSVLAAPVANPVVFLDLVKVS